MPNIDFIYPNDEKPNNYLQLERTANQMYLRVFDAFPNSSTIFTWQESDRKYLIGSDIGINLFHDAESRWHAEHSQG